MDLLKEIINVLSNDYLDRREKARTNFKDFILYMKEDYELTWFHEAVIDDLHDFIYCDSNRNMLFAPPQHGKSEISSRMLPAFLMGINPGYKLAILCYSKTVAEGFSTDVQNIIASDEYGALFPETRIDGVRGLKKGVLKRNSYEFHTDKGGYLISVGVGGPLTSKTVDIAIIDDLYKDLKDAWSSIYRQRVENWYWAVLETRLHNDSKVLILYTRWHPNDLAGNLIKSEGELWNQSKYEMVKTGKVLNDKDKREKGEALWPSKHSVEKAIRWKERDPISFEALGQQNPKPKEGLLYSTHKVYTELPDINNIEHIRKNYTDTADTGSDYLSSICYIECDGLCYIIDLIYTQDSMEYTEPMTANMLKLNKIDYAKIESNNGGRGFARAVERELKDINGYTGIEWFHQSDNKEARIFSNSAKVINRVIWPHDWKVRWPEVYDSYTTYMREGKNEHDDLQDTLTGIVENIETGIHESEDLIFI